jgi:hypothetical protein
MLFLLLRFLQVLHQLLLPLISPLQLLLLPPLLLLVVGCYSSQTSSLWPPSAALLLLPPQMAPLSPLLWLLPLLLSPLLPLLPLLLLRYCSCLLPLSSSQLSPPAVAAAVLHPWHSHSDQPP